MSWKRSECQTESSRVTLERLAAIVVKSVHCILVTGKSCWNGLSRRVVSSGLCLIKRSLWLLRRELTLGGRMARIEHRKLVAAVAVVHSRDGLGVLGLWDEQWRG